MRKNKGAVIGIIVVIGLALFIVFILFSGDPSVIGNPTAKEILQGNKDADILQWETLIYKTNIDWVDAANLVVGEKVGEIERQTSKPRKFKHKTANKLEVGTEIFEVEPNEYGRLLAAKHNGEWKFYYALIEG